MEVKMRTIYQTIKQNQLYDIYEYRNKLLSVVYRLHPALKGNIEFHPSGSLWTTRTTLVSYPKDALIAFGDRVSFDSIKIEAGTFIADFVLDSAMSKMPPNLTRIPDMRVKVNVDNRLKEFIHKSQNDWKAVLGKTWKEGVNGALVGYLYITKTNSCFAKHALAYIESFYAISSNKVETPVNVDNKSIYMEPGRYEFDIELLRVKTAPCDYKGTRYIGVFRTSDGKLINGNPSFCDNDAIGTKYRIRATVRNKYTINSYIYPHLVQRFDSM